MAWRSTGCVQEYFGGVHVKSRTRISEPDLQLKLSECQAMFRDTTKIQTSKHEYTQTGRSQGGSGAVELSKEFRLRNSTCLHGSYVHEQPAEAQDSLVENLLNGVPVRDLLIGSVASLVGRLEIVLCS